MPQITYVEADGRSTTLSITEGWNLMQGAITQGVEGLIGECGGSCSCGTCHCYVEEARQGELPPPSSDELAMLDMVVAERRPTSRLACQLKATAALEGLVIHLPDAQL